MKTHIFCILDRSGSMGGLEKATIDGYNEFIGGLREEPDANLTLVLFDDKYEVVLDDVPLKQVPILGDKTYFVRGGTALVDAVCHTINERKGNVGKDERALVLIITDGYENSSHEYKSADMKKLIGDLEKQGNWTYTYLGANQDAWSVAQQYGFSTGNVATYNASSAGTAAAYGSITTQSVNLMRSASMSVSNFYVDSKDKLKQTK